VATAVSGWCLVGVACSNDDAPTCPFPIADYGTVDAFAGARAARTIDGVGNEMIAWLGGLQQGPTADVLDVQLVGGAGAFAGGAPHAGTFALTGAETQLATCGVCVVVKTRTPREHFVAQSGTLVIDELGPSGTGRFRATLTDASFVHVSVDFETSMSVVLDDGCHTSITAASWDTPID
jgi:hypothetical protein